MKKYAGGGVSACATCDGFFYKGQKVVVVGGGDTAAEEATYLSKLCSNVTLLVRKDEFRASKAMVHRVMNTPNIEVKFNHELIGIEGENNLVERAVIINNKTQETSKIDAMGIFIAIGHQPNTELFKGQITLDEKGYIATEKRLFYNQSTRSFCRRRCTRPHIPTSNYRSRKRLYGCHRCRKISRRT